MQYQERARQGTTPAEYLESTPPLIPIYGGKLIEHDGAALQTGTTTAIGNKQSGEGTE